MMGTGVCTVAAICVLAGCKSRPPAPPADLEVGPPWGILRRGSLFADDQRASFAFERDLEGKPRWPILVLAGTGSRTAFAAGLLGGWSETGERPRFQVVTGVGPAATLATFAFLGSDFDQTLNSMYVLETLRAIHDLVVNILTFQ